MGANLLGRTYLSHGKCLTGAGRASASWSPLHTRVSTLPLARPPGRAGLSHALCRALPAVPGSHAAGSRDANTASGAEDAAAKARAGASRLEEEASTSTTSPEVASSEEGRGKGVGWPPCRACASGAASPEWHEATPPRGRPSHVRRRQPRSFPGSRFLRAFRFLGS